MNSLCYKDVCLSPVSENVAKLFKAIVLVTTCIRAYQQITSKSKPKKVKRRNKK